MTDNARLARALLGQAAATFRVVPDGARGGALAELDRFLAAPAPATFVAAARVLRDVRRSALIERTAGSTMRRAFTDGVAALRAVPGLPSPLVDRIVSDLPVDARAGQRLLAVAALARAYDELASRVAADSDEMRRRLRDSAPRKSSARR
jgi:hypothetical protein